MVEKAAEFIRSKTDDGYEIGIICGSGLGGLCDSVENPIYVNYSDIPNFRLRRVISAGSCLEHSEIKR